jgi:hypothetical protein
VDPIGLGLMPEQWWEFCALPMALLWRPGAWHDAQLVMSAVIGIA